jgi:heat shock protein HslJ
MKVMIPISGLFLFCLICLLQVFSGCSPKAAPDTAWSDKKWVAMEINGVPVQTGNTDKDAHLVFEPAKRTFFGSGGCNRITGAYQIEKKGKISFSNVASTKMACNDQAFEDYFLNAVASVNGFTLDGQTLVLKKDGNTVMKLR